MTAKHLQDTTTLYNGVNMPWFGLGVFKVEEGPELVNAVRTAIQHGYRSVDTAAIYGNEEGVGQGIREGLAAAGLKREICSSHPRCGMPTWVMNRLWRLMRKACESWDWSIWTCTLYTGRLKGNI